jgi:YwiC-like protein
MRPYLPREHGAYGELLLPLASALAIGRPGAAAIAFTLAALLAFLAHEPLLLVLGQRGARVGATYGAGATRVLVGLGGLAAAAGIAGIAWTPAAARPATLVPAALGAAVLVLVWRRHERTLAGELTVAAALSSCSLAVAAAGGVPLAAALGCWITWLLAFAVVNVTVRALIERWKTRGVVDRRPAAAATAGAAIGAATLGVVHDLLAPAALVALLPTALTALALTIAPVAPRQLRASGWALVAATGATAASLAFGMG